MSARKRTAVLGVTFVGACGVAVATHLWVRDPLGPVMSAAGRMRHRPVEARVMGLAYGERASPSRGERESSAGASRMCEAAWHVAERFGDSDEPRDLHLTGVASLVGGRGDAVEKLREAAERMPDEPRYWTDLSAALYGRAISEANPHDLAHALAAADRALQLAPALPEALFNRALVIEELHLPEDAVAAWDAYLSVDSTSSWAGEARRRADHLREWLQQRLDIPAVLRVTHGGSEIVLAPLVAVDAGLTRRVAETATLANWSRATERGDLPEAKSWLADARTIGRLLRARAGESMVADAVAAIDTCARRECIADLAEAHRRYDEARRAYSPRQRLVTKALPQFRDVARLFRKHGSPMAFVADYYVANCLEDSTDGSAVQEAERLLATVPEKYPSLRAQVSSLLATNRARVGETAAAFELYAHALDAFTRLGERGYANDTRDSLAAVAALLGRETDAWRLRVAASAGYAESGLPGEVHRSLELAGRMEVVAGHWDEAASLLALAIGTSPKYSERTEVSAMLWRALAISRTGLHDEARWQLGAARRFAWSISDETLRQAALDDLTFAEAVVTMPADPGRAAALFDRFAASSENRRRTFLRADAHLERARAARALGHLDDAERYYRVVVATIDAQRKDAQDRGIVDAYFATATAASNELTELLVSQVREEEAFAALEAGRGRAVLGRLARGTEGAAELLPAQAVRDRLDPRTVLVAYLFLREQGWIFTLSQRDGLHVTRSLVPLADVERGIRRLRLAIAREDVAAADAEAERLNDVFVAPVEARLTGADALVIVPDPAMETMPFAVLRDDGGRRVVDRFAVTFAPSAAVFANAAARPADDSGGVLVFGNPAFDRDRHAALEALPAATREAADVAKQYAGADLAAGADATASRFLELLPAARLVHVATHAVPNPRDPMRSLLLFAPAGEHSGDVRAEEIVRASCRADVVVLAACQTSFPAETPSDIGTISLAFLAAGARNVVGTLWNVDDEDAAAFSRHFHAELRSGTKPAEAVRRAQHELLRTRPLRAWGAFTIMGVGR